MAKNLIQGLIDGVNNMIETAKNAVANVGNAVIDKVKNVLGIHSPSTVFAEIGGYIVQGLANGINAASPYVEQAMTNLANVVQQKGNEMIDYGADVANGFVDNMVNTFDAKWNEIDNGLKSDFIGTIKGMIDAVKKGDIQTVAENTAAIIWKAMGEENRKQVKSYASDLVSNLTSALKTVGSKVFSSAKLVGNNILAGITSKFGEISTQVVGLGSKIASSFSSSDWANLGIRQGDQYWPFFWRFEPVPIYHRWHCRAYRSNWSCFYGHLADDRQRFDLSWHSNRRHHDCWRRCNCSRNCRNCRNACRKARNKFRSICKRQLFELSWHE